MGALPPYFGGISPTFFSRTAPGRIVLYFARIDFYLVIAHIFTNFDINTTTDVYFITTVDNWWIYDDDDVRFSDSAVHLHHQLVGSANVRLCSAVKSARNGSVLARGIRVAKNIQSVWKITTVSLAVSSVQVVHSVYFNV